MNGDQSRRASALGENFAHAMAGSLGRDQRDVDILGRLDGAEADIEAVSEHQRLARFEVGRNVVLVGFALRMIRREDHDDVRPCRGVAHGIDFKAGLLRLVDRLAGSRAGRRGPRRPSP